MHRATPRRIAEREGEVLLVADRRRGARDLSRQPGTRLEAGSEIDEIALRRRVAARRCETRRCRRLSCGRRFVVVATTRGDERDREQKQNRPGAAGAVAYDS